MPEPQHPPDPAAIYQVRLTTLAAEHTTTQNRVRNLRRLLLATAILAILLFAFALGGRLPLRILLLPLSATLVLVPFLLTSRRRLDRLRCLLNHVHAALSRVAGIHPQSGHTGEDLEIARERNHLYRHDLQILGSDSLFGLLATARTRLGRESLARTLLHPPPNSDLIHARQLAIRELAPQTALREQLALLGEHATDEIPSTDILAWLAHPPAAIPGSTRPLLLVTISLSLLALLAGASHLASWPLVRLNLAAILALQAALALRVRSHVTPILADARRLPRQIALLTEAISLMGRTSVQAPLLGTLRTQVSDAGAGLDGLNRILALVEQRNNQYFFLPALLLALGTQSAISLDRWRSHHADSLRRWMEAFAAFENLNALATYAFEHPANTYPEILAPGTPPAFHATALTHPLIPRATVVPNNIALDANTRFYLISGSNMAGKSTLLRTVGTAAVLALAGAPIPASSARLSPFTLCASISVTDSLADGKSKFLAEVERLHAILQATQTNTAVVIPTEGAAAAERPASPTSNPTSVVIPTEGAAAAEGPAPPTHTANQPVLFLIDEIFSGTNSADRLTAAAAVVRQLVAAGALGALSTHDLALTVLAEPPADPSAPDLHGRNLHMASPDPNNPLAFDYLLKPGVNPTTNALAILRLIGIHP